MLHKEIGQIE
jgi:hypothetical protein